jgi:CelD/BcsL family acetyltransferase involved in cellulose biosynthesis
MLHYSPQLANLEIDIAFERDFDFLSDEYRDLFEISDATAFQAPIWMDKMHQILVPELNATAYTLTARNRADKSLLAVFPFVKQKAAGLTVIQPADFGVCDYNAIVAENQTLEVMAHKSAVLEQLDELVNTGSLFMFRKVPVDGFDISRLFPDATPSPSENAGYHCIVADNFEEWRRVSLRRKMTKELERKSRQLQKLHGEARLVKATTSTEIYDAMKFIQEVRGKRFANDLMQSPVYFDFYYEYAIAAAKSGEAALYVKYVNDKPAAALFSLMGDGGFHGVLIAADIENFGKFSLGVQIIYQTIQEQFAAGLRRFDFGLGNNGYKSHFRVEKTELQNFTAANNLAGASIAAIYTHAKPIKNIARKLVPHLR